MLRTFVMLTALLAFACGGTDGDDGLDNPLPAPAVADAGFPTSTTGGLCDCDSECPPMGSNAGVCVRGVCMSAPRGECSAPGSTLECPAGSRCWTVDRKSICYPDCATYECAGICDAENACVPTDDTECNPSCDVVCDE